MLRCLLVDFNSYFASVEQQLQPGLRGKPVGIVPLMADTTCCIAASYEAKAHGVKTGTMVAEARRLCPNIIFIEARHAHYVAFHQRAIAIVDRLIPVERVLSIDEMACTLPQRWQSPKQAEKIARDIKQALFMELGECLRTSIGIAANTLLAKLASNLQKPDGLVILQAHELPQRIAGLAVQKLNGIGPRMAQRLAQYGVETIGQLWALTPQQMRVIWGGVAGLDFYDKLRGHERHLPQRERQSVSHSHMLPPHERTLLAAFAVLDRLLQKAAMRLRKENFLATGLYLGVRMADRYKWSAETHLPATNETPLLLHALQQLWARDLALLVRHRAQPLKVSVGLFGLCRPQHTTYDLFEAPVACVGTSRVVDQLNRRFGKNTIYYGSAHLARDSAPMRIAFNRIPDIETEA